MLFYIYFFLTNQMLFYIFQLQCALEGNKDNITMTIILSMKKSEIEAHVDKVSNSP